MAKQFGVVAASVVHKRHFLGGQPGREVELGHIAESMVVALILHHGVLVIEVAQPLFVEGDIAAVGVASLQRESG